MEREALEQAATSPLVVALGGGAVVIGDVRDALARVAHVAWLTAPEDVLWGRGMDGVQESRPLAASRETFGRLLREREAVYAQVATTTVINDGSRAVDDVAAGLAALVRGTTGGSRDDVRGGAS